MTTTTATHRGFWYRHPNLRLAGLLSGANVGKALVRLSE